MDGNSAPDLCRWRVPATENVPGYGAPGRHAGLYSWIICFNLPGVSTWVQQPVPKTMDIIYLNDLRVDAVTGIYEWERKIKQTLSFDVELAAPAGRAAQSDRIEDTVNYEAVANRLSSYVSASEFELLETLAERVAQLLMEEFKVSWCRLRVNKHGAVPGVRDVGIIMERGSRD